jgi:hypothetical protein
MSNVLDLNLYRTVREKASNDPEFRRWLATLVQESDQPKTFGYALSPYKINKVTFNGREIGPQYHGQ